MFNRKLIYAFLSTFALQLTALAQNQQGAYLNYIEDYKALAIAEMERAGIPASIKLAQGLLESDAGRSDLATKAKNHFGMKCGSKWMGDTFKKFDDEYNALGMRVKSCFRSFNSVHDSYVAHSDFLRNAPSRYGFLFDLDPTDYKGWAKGLKKAGYATSSDYSRRLISIIEQYELHQYDLMTTSEILAATGGKKTKNKETIEGKPIPTPASQPALQPAAPLSDDRTMKPVEFLVNNDVKYVETPMRQSVSQLAEAIDIPLRAILSYNENIVGAEQILEPGTRVYVQPKRNSYRGREAFHTVGKGETMIDISIRYGVSLSKLYFRNQVEPGLEPVAGTEIKLKGKPVTQRPTVYKPQLAPEKDTPAIAAASSDPESVALDMEIEGNAKYRSTHPATAEEREQLKDDPFSFPASRKTAVAPLPTSVDTPNTAKPTLVVNDLPGSEEAKKPATAGEPALFHVVKDGDTLWSISNQYNTTVEKILEINDLSDTNLKRDMKVRVR